MVSRLTLLLLAFLGLADSAVMAQGDPVYFLNGSAQATGDDCYEITPALNTQTGSVWYADQVDLSQPLDLQFILNLGNNDGNGADGICFVLQTVGVEVIGESGGGIGFLGADFQPAFAVEFDTWQNADFGDPIGDHIAMVSNGSVNHLLPSAIAGPVQADAFDPNIEDGEDHQGRVTWNPETQLVQVYFDCELRLEGVVNLIDDIFEGQNQVFFGFTAGTGGANNLQTVCLEENILGSAAESFVCPGAELQLNVPSPNGLATWTPTDYLDDPASASPVASPPEGLGEPIVYVVDYLDNCGVAVTDTIQLNVDVMTANVEGVTDLTCEITELELTAESNFPGPLDFQWSAISGGIQAVDGLASVDLAGSYALLISFQNGLCEAETTFDVGVDTTSATGEFPAELFLTCNDPTATLEASALTPFNAAVTWNTLNGQIQGNGAVVSALEAGAYVATVSHPSNGCTSLTNVAVLSADQAPQILLGTIEPITCLNPGQPVVGAGVTDYAPFGLPGLTPVVSWTNADNGTTQGVSPSNGSFGPIINAAGDYQLVVEWAETGCSDSILISASQGEDFGLDISSIAFPNVLTANNDGRNDSWRPFLEDFPDVEALSVLTNYALRVYNRWGALVFSNSGDGFSSGTPIRWYGNGGGGAPLTSGTYWYVVDYTSTCGNSQSGTATGSLKLIRE
jgi:gliding motility-associated-like protein